LRFGHDIEQVAFALARACQSGGLSAGPSALTLGSLRGTKTAKARTWGGSVAPPKRKRLSDACRTGMTGRPNAGPCGPI